MYQSSLKYLRCVKCGHQLELQVYEAKNEIIEGMITCVNCNGMYPIISSIPFLIGDLSSYFSIRAKLGGYLLLNAKSPQIKSVLKKSLREIRRIGEDTTDLEKNWVEIYKKSKQLSFKTKMRNITFNLPKCNFVVEHGCSIGIMSEILAKRHDVIFGIDKSFFALLEAKRRKIKNADFFLADSLSPPFGTMKFDLVVALNVLELIEPLKLLRIIGLQVCRFVIMSDPYDYERGKRSVKIRLDERSLRKKMEQMGLKLSLGTSKPSFIPWNLVVNPRLELGYKIDLILASVTDKSR